MPSVNSLIVFEIHHQVSVVPTPPRYSIEGAGANFKRIRAYRFEEPGKGLVTTQLLNQGAAILGTQCRGAF